MRKIFLLIIIISLISCSKDTGVPSTSVQEGIQCDIETRNSKFNVEGLVEDIRGDLVSYLNLEYGAPHNSEPLTVQKITYRGVYPACGTKIKIWSYPCGGADCYVGILPWKNTYLTSMLHPTFKVK